MNPLVTICVPTTGRTDYLDTAAKSLRSQTYDNIEVIILDNASGIVETNAFHGVVSARANTRIVASHPRIPMFANFNRGIAEARGKYVVFFHDDDLYDPEFVERYVDLLERYPTAAFAGGNYRIIGRGGEELRRRTLVRSTELWTGERFSRDVIRRGIAALPTPGLVFRRDAFGPEGFDERLPVNWGDVVVFLRMAETHDVAVTNRALYAWRTHGANESNIPFSKSIPLRTQVLDDYIRELAARRPEAVSLVSRFRKDVKKGHARGLLWGWFAGRDSGDASECRSMLKGSSAFLASVLVAFERMGFSFARRRALFPTLRRFALGVIR